MGPSSLPQGCVLHRLLHRHKGGDDLLLLLGRRPEGLRQHLIDGLAPRHKPTADDVTMASWFRDTGCPLVVAANKLDKLKKSEMACGGRPRS